MSDQEDGIKPPPIPIPQPKAKRKYKYTKKTGRPKLTIKTATEKGRLPENWQEIVILLSLQGKFEEQIRRDLVISAGHDFQSIKATWFTLQQNEAEFLETIKKGAILRKAWWLDKVQKGIDSTFFNTAAWFIVMKNCFGWQDKKEIDLGLTDETWEKYKSLSVTEIRDRLNALTGPKLITATDTEEAV